ncbi:MAG TPA: STAS domain-containing protein [Vicinamibacterales bacterium]|jgi:anti-anti-sigma regulatory factor
MNTAESHSIEIDRSATSPRLMLRGRLTVGAARQLHVTALDLARSGTDVTVCCEAVEHADAAILQILIALGAALNRDHHRLALVNASDGFNECLRLAGLYDRLVPERS